MNSSTLTSKHWLLIYLLTLLCAAGVGYLYAAKFEPETKFWAGVFEKRRSEMAERNDERHVLFTGDSACSFGIDTSIFTTVTGTPSMNMGGTRQMGTAIFMEETLRYAREGDTIVLICNPNLLVSDFTKDGEVSNYTKSGAQMAIALSMESAPTKVKTGTQPGFNHLLSLVAKISLRKPLLRYRLEDYQVGGLITTQNRERPPSQRNIFKMSSEDTDKFLSTLHYWHLRCAAQKIELCYLLPIELTDKSILRASRKKKQDFIERVRVSANPAITILKTPENACSSVESEFSDTLFHLTEQGAAKFTRNLARDLH